MPDNNNLTIDELTKLNYDGEMTLEALATLDMYMKQCCNVSATARKLHKGYLQVRKYLRQPYVREIFQLKLMEKGTTPDKIAEVIKGGVEANRNVYYLGAKVSEDSDWLARQKFVQLACEIYEVLKYNSKIDSNVLINQFNITNLQGEALIREAQKRNIPLPPEIERRFNGK